MFLTAEHRVVLFAKDKRPLKRSLVMVPLQRIESFKSSPFFIAHDTADRKGVNGFVNLNST